ncbi:MAG: threonine synthase [Clostridia bacterium]|nr:threonine synthase [Clostridia bacterium]
MLYKSTRNNNLKVTASEAIARGISEEGGLFVPEYFPSVRDKLSYLRKLDYISLSKEILSLYLTDYTKEEIGECAEKAYETSKFSGEQVRLHEVENEDGIYSLELWHGPTCAFKDMALQILPHLLTKAFKKQADGKKAVILVATSGDTGKAALEGFKDVENTQIIVFYPENGVSPMQLRQMNTQEGENVCVCAVKGNFDDCQTQVKRIFTSPELKVKLSENNMLFSSANSINWGRLLPQIVYYFYAYFRFLDRMGVEDEEEAINIVVPTGNFGNILAAYYAKMMGLPVNKFICASNSNNVLTDFINTGKYDKQRKFYTTISPSMDILVSSNLERLLYHLTDGNDKKTAEWMKALNEKGEYTVDAIVANKVKELFAAYCCGEADTSKTINSCFENSAYLIDTHTAVAFKAINDYREENDDYTPAVIASTASPYKFSKSVLSAISDFESDDEFVLVEKLSEVSGLEVPKSLKALKEKKTRFTNVCDRESIASFVLDTLGIEG